MNNPYKIKPLKLSSSAVKCDSCVLSHLCIPSALSPAEMSELDKVNKSKSHLAKDEILFKTGESKHKIYAISSGSLKTAITNKSGIEQITGFYLPGEIIGLDGLADMQLNSTATAIESSTVCEIPENEFDRLCETNKGLRKSFMRIVSKEIASEQQMMMSLGQMKSDEKLASFLISLSSRFKQRGFSATEFNLSMPRHDIANYLGLTIETISRLFKKFQQLKYLKVNHRNIIITNRDALCDLAHSSCNL